MSIPNQLLPDEKIKLNNQRELTLLALLVWAEARGESTEGKTAVAHVVMNRYAVQGWMGRTVREVIIKPWQFSCFNHDDPNREKMMRVTNDDTWNRCAQSAWDAYLGLSTDPTDGATHYCRFDWNPQWRKEMKFIKQIGNHVFYK